MCSNINNIEYLIRNSFNFRQFLSNNIFSNTAKMLTASNSFLVVNLSIHLPLINCILQLRIKIVNDIEGFVWKCGGHYETRKKYC